MKRISINMIGQLVSFACSLIIGFWMTPYIVAHLGQETYGFVGLANNFTSYITLFTVALNGMLSRYITIEYSKKNYEKASGYFTTAMVAQCVLAVILLIPMMLLAGHVDAVVNISSDIVPDVKVLWALLFISFLMGLPMASFGTTTFVKNRLEISAGISVAGNLLRTVVILVTFLFFTPHVWYVGLGTILANTLTLICNFICKIKMVPEIKLDFKHFNFKYIKELLLVGVWNSLNKLQQILYTGLDLLLTNLFISGSEMGILSVAKTVPTQISTLISTISSAFDPSMTISYGKGQMDEFLKQTKFAMKSSGFLCSVPILGFIFFGINFYTLWMPTMGEADIMKVQILAVLTLLPQVFSIYIFPLYTINTVTTKLKVPVLVSIGIGIVNIATVFILLKTTNLGVYAVAGVSSILWLFRIFLFVPSYAAYILKTKLTIFYGPLFRGVANVCVVGLFMYIMSKLFFASSWLELIIYCGFSGAIGYVICFFVMFKKDDRNMFFKMIKNKLHKKVEKA